MILSKIEYLRSLHDLIYTANMADSGVHKQDWQNVDMVSEHCNVLYKLVRDVVGEGHVDVFFDHFGDFDGFAKRLEAE